MVEDSLSASIRVYNKDGKTGHRPVNGNIMAGERNISLAMIPGHAGEQGKQSTSRS